MWEPSEELQGSFIDEQCANAGHYGTVLTMADPEVA